MRQINPDVFAAFPITPSTEIPQYFAQYRGRRAGGHRVRHRGERALLHVHLHGGPGRRRPGGDRHLLLRAGLHVRDALRHRLRPPARHPGGGQPRPHRPHQHQQRPLRLHGRPGLRLDPDLCREQPGGLRQLPPGHAHRRAAPGAPAHHDLPGRVHHLPRGGEHPAGAGRGRARLRGGVPPGALPAQARKPPGRGRLRHLPLLHGAQGAAGPGHGGRPGRHPGRGRRL